MTGLSLAHYHIDAELGRGGMGIVYRATDTKLNRTVALKVLPAAALASDEDRARFFREAQAAAQLHHPNIATVFQIDEAVPVDDAGKERHASDGPRLFIAMEFVDGETLYDRTKKGPFPLKEAVSVAGQIAEALKEAHAKEIVHRDIKSQNVMITEDGIAKVLDFGLAKTNASTMLTRMGSTLGTVAYMSPEQARGNEVDGRTDLYSLGTVLYEMVAGRLPFGGDYEQAILYSILNEPPEPLTALRTGVPMELERITGKLLAKEAEYRYQSAAGLLADLKSLALDESGTTRRLAAVAPGKQSAGESADAPLWMWGLVAGALVAGGFIGLLLAGDASDRSSDFARFSIDLPLAANPLRVAWGADGTEVYYVAQDTSGAGTNHIRRYSPRSGQARRVQGTENADWLDVSPDGRWLAFHDAQGAKHRRLPLPDGEPTDIPGAESAIPDGRHGPSGLFYWTTDSGALLAVNDQGQTTEIANNDTLDNSPFLASPVENGNGLFWVGWRSPTHTSGTWASLNGGSASRVLDRFSLNLITPEGIALVFPTGVFGEPAAIARIDATSGHLTSPPIPFARMQFDSVDLSANGHLIYQELDPARLDEYEPLYEVGADGRRRYLGEVPGLPHDFAVSPSGDAVVFETALRSRRNRDLFFLDLADGTPTRLTRDGINRRPYFSSDGEYVYFDRRTDGQSSIARVRRDNLSGGIETVLSDSAGIFGPVVVDGLMLVARSVDDGSDRILHDLDSRASPVVVASNAYHSDLSPDLRYLVYSSSFNTNGPILVRSIDGTGEIEIAPLGNRPAWARDGRWIYYHNGREVYRIEVTTDPVFSVQGNPELVYQASIHVHFGLSSDGRLFISEPEHDEQSDVWVVLNFADEARRQVEEVER